MILKKARKFARNKRQKTSGIIDINLAKFYQRPEPVNHQQ